MGFGGEALLTAVREKRTPARRSWERALIRASDTPRRPLRNLLVCAEANKHVFLDIILLLSPTLIGWPAFSLPFRP